MTKNTYTYLDDHGNPVTVTEINPSMVVTDTENIDIGVYLYQREAEPEQSPYNGEYPDEGGMFLAIVGGFFVFAILALGLIALAQGAL